MRRFYREAPAFLTVEALEKFARKRMGDDMETWAANMVCAILLVAEKDGKKDVSEKCLDRLMSDSQTLNAIRNVVHCNYARYGVDELKCVYDSVSIKEAYERTVKGTRKQWKRLKLDRLLVWFDGTVPYQQAKFINTVIGCRVREAYHIWMLEEARKKFPTLSSGSLKLFIKIRKTSGYEIQLVTYTVEEIVQFCEKNGIRHTWGQVVAMMQSLGYEVEDSEKRKPVPLHETPEWKSTHRNEILFWKDTHANEIREDECEAWLDTIQQRMGYREDEMVCIRNWLNIARYEGRAENMLREIPSSLDKRYRIRDTDTDIAICRRVRYDIIKTFGNKSRVLYTLSKNLGGRITLPA